MGALREQPAGPLLPADRRGQAPPGGRGRQLGPAVAGRDPDPQSRSGAGGLTSRRSTDRRRAPAPRPSPHPPGPGGGESAPPKGGAAPGGSGPPGPGGG